MANCGTPNADFSDRPRASPPLYPLDPVVETGYGDFSNMSTVSNTAVMEWLRTKAQGRGGAL